MGSPRQPVIAGPNPGLSQQTGAMGSGNNSGLDPNAARYFDLIQQQMNQGNQPKSQQAGQFSSLIQNASPSIFGSLLNTQSLGNSFLNRQQGSGSYQQNPITPQSHFPTYTPPNAGYPGDASNPRMNSQQGSMPQYPAGGISPRNPTTGQPNYNQSSQVQSNVQGGNNSQGTPNYIQSPEDQQLWQQLDSQYKAGQVPFTPEQSAQYNFLRSRGDSTGNAPPVGGQYSGVYSWDPNTMTGDLPPGAMNMAQLIQQHMNPNYQQPAGGSGYMDANGQYQNPNGAAFTGWNGNYDQVPGVGNGQGGAGGGGPLDLAAISQANPNLQSLQGIPGLSQAIQQALNKAGGGGNVGPANLQAANPSAVNAPNAQLNLASGNSLDPGNQSYYDAVNQVLNNKFTKDNADLAESFGGTGTGRGTGASYAQAQNRAAQAPQIASAMGGVRQQEIANQLQGANQGNNALLTARSQDIGNSQQNVQNLLQSLGLNNQSQLAARGQDVTLQGQNQGANNNLLSSLFGAQGQQNQGTNDLNSMLSQLSQFNAGQTNQQNLAVGTLNQSSQQQGIQNQLQSLLSMLGMGGQLAGAGIPGAPSINSVGQTQNGNSFGSTLSGIGNLLGAISGFSGGGNAGSRPNG